MKQPLAAAAVISMIFPETGFADLFCKEPSEPYGPSGYSADYDQMERSQREVLLYLEEAESYLDCLRDEHERVQDEAESVRDQWESTVWQFNNRLRLGDTLMTKVTEGGTVGTVCTADRTWKTDVLTGVYS